MSLAHVRTLVWLRSRLTWNHFTRGKKWVAVLGIIIRLVIGIATVGLAVGGFLLGLHVLADVSRAMLWATWSGVALCFLFMWMIAVLSEVQRSESIDVRRLMHLPISLRQVFLINYLASLFSPGLILAVPASCALALGLVLGRGSHMAWLFPVLFAFYFSVTAWTYCLRGWLVNLMINKRRRRAIIMGMTAAVVLAGQLPNIIIHTPLVQKQFQHQPRGSEQDADSAGVEPPPPMRQVFTHIRDIPLRRIAIPLFLGGTLVGGLGLRHAHRVTVSFYTSRGTRRRSRTRKRTRVSRARRILVQRRIPFVSEPVSALTVTLIRSSLRAPEIRMTLLMPFIMGLVFGMMFLGRSSGAGLPHAFRSLPALGAVAFSMLGTAQFVFNAFGQDRDAFRNLILLPVNGNQILLAKNLSLFPFSVGIGCVLLLLVAAALHLYPWTILATLVQLVAVYVILCIPGNFASIRVPFRLAGASLRKPKIPPQTVLLVLLFHLAIPVVLLVVAIPPLLGMVVTPINPWYGALINLGGSIGFLILAGLAYAWTLPPAGRYLKTRERDILRAVTAESE